MKKLFVALALTSLVGCDNAANSNGGQATNSKPSIDSMIASGTEEKTAECIKGRVSLDCEFLSGDLLGSGKWHHAKAFISTEGKVSVVVDGESFYVADSSSNFYEGQNEVTFNLKGLKNSKAELTLRSSNSNSEVSLDVWDSNDKHFMLANYQP